MRFAGARAGWTEWVRGLSAALTAGCVLLVVSPAWGQEGSEGEGMPESSPAPVLVAGSGPALMLVGIGVGAVLTNVSEDAAVFTMVGSAVLLPSVGNLWMGDFKHAALWGGVRLLSVAAGTLGLAMIIAGAFGGSAEFAGLGVVVGAVGVAGLATGIVMDTVTAARNARRRRALLSGAVVPYLVPTGDGHGLRAGLAFAW